MLSLGPWKWLASGTRGINVRLAPGPVAGRKRENCVEMGSLGQLPRFAEVHASPSSLTQKLLDLVSTLVVSLSWPSYFLVC